MNEIDAQADEIEKIKNMPVQSENIAFDALEMIVCAACERTNPPTRLKCFYCAAELENDGKHLKADKLTVRKLESFEKGYNLIYAGRAAHEINYQRIADAVNTETEIVEKIVESNKKLPLLRVETEREAKFIAENLHKLGIETKIISDQILAADKLPIRLRGLEFEEDKIIAIHFNADAISEIEREDLILIVKGTIFERKIEAVENRKKGEVKILQQSDTASDEAVLDVYSRSNEFGYRIFTKGFDFSGLGAEKGLLAAENLKKLAAKLGELAPDAQTVDDYAAVREMLGVIWEVEHRRDSQGLKQHSFSKFDFANVESSNNLQQFTKYSRLRRQMI